MEGSAENSLDLQTYRDDLAKKITGEPDRLLRRQELSKEKQTDVYQSSSILKVEERFRNSMDEVHQRWLDSRILLDVKLTIVGTGFEGATGKYKFLERPTEKYLHDSIVENEEGQKFYVTEKMAREQLLASLIGNYLVSKNERLRRLHFPKILLENINESQVALVEYFSPEDYEPGYSKSVTKKDFACFSEDEKDFLLIFNLWIGNWDFKPEHIFVSKDHRNLAVGLIDLEMSFDFKNPKRLEEVGRKSPFLGKNGKPKSKINKYFDFIENLSLSDRNAIINLAVSSGFKPQETIGLVLALFKRRDIIEEELATVESLYQADVSSNISSKKNEGLFSKLRRLIR